MFSSISRVLLCLSMMLFALCFTFDASAQTLQDDSLKANYIEGFIDFVRINGDTLPKNTRIAVVDDKELATYLKKVVADNPTNQFEVDSLSSDDLDSLDSTTYPVIFLGSGSRNHWAHFFQKTKNTPSLIIGENHGFLEAGGCIEFVVIKNRIRFRVNSENLDSRDIQLSSKLLDLAID